MPARARRNKKLHRQRNGSALAIILVVLAVFIVSTVGGIRLRQKNQNYRAKEEALLQSIEEEKERNEELRALEAYTETNKYVEDVAKEKLGLVYEDEIIFKPED